MAYRKFSVGQVTLGARVSIEVASRWKPQLLVASAIAVGSALGGCSCSVDVSKIGGDAGKASTTTEKRDSGRAPSPDAAHTSNNDTAQIDVTLNTPDAAQLDVTLGTLDRDAHADPDANIVDAASVDSGDARALGCTSLFTACEDGVVHTCSTLGEPEQLFTCANGCDAETSECLPLQLDQGWFVHQFVLTDDGIQTPANYVFESDGLVAIQTANPLPSAYVKEVEFANFVARGKVSVVTSSDDDMFGFVFGWQDPEHFYLVDWKQSQQSYSVCGLAPAGIALKLVNSDTPLESCLDFWSGTGSEKVTPLVPATGSGWAEYTVYDFELVFRPGDIHLTITAEDVVVSEIVSNDTTYTSGLFGFYNYSQQGVRYEFFTIEPAP